MAGNRAEMVLPRFVRGSLTPHRPLGTVGAYLDEREVRVRAVQAAVPETVRA